MAAKKSNKPKKSSPAPRASKLNLVALKPQDKEPETQPESVPELVEPPAPIVAPIQQTAAPAPALKEPPSTTPAQPALVEQSYGQNPPSEIGTVGEGVSGIEFANTQQPAPNTLTPHLNQDQPLVAVPSEQGLIVPFPNSNAMFQAIGIIVGTVKFKGKNRCQVIIGDKQYPLFPTLNLQKPYTLLKKEIETTGNQQQRLIVYPQVGYFRSEEQPYRVGFSLMSFDRPTRKSEMFKKLEDFQFILRGFLQFISNCSIPCISVYRNFDSDRASYIKKAPPRQREKFFKARHVPVIWEEAPVKPFKFNPKLDKDQQEHALFVEILTQFLPEKDAFSFIQLCSKPSQTAPRFFQANRENQANPKIKTIH